MQYPNGRITLGNRVVAYAVRQSARARRLGLWVDPATGVVVTLPRGFSARRIEPFLARHERWILRQLERLERVAAQIPPRWPYGTTLPYRGDEYAVLIRPAARSAADCVIRHSWSVHHRGGRGRNPLVPALRADPDGRRFGMPDTLVFG